MGCRLHPVRARCETSSGCGSGPDAPSRFAFGRRGWPSLRALPRGVTGACSVVRPGRGSARDAGSRPTQRPSPLVHGARNYLRPVQLWPISLLPLWGPLPSSARFSWTSVRPPRSHRTSQHACGLSRLECSGHACGSPGKRWTDTAPCGRFGARPFRPSRGQDRRGGQLTTR